MDEIFENHQIRSQTDRSWLLEKRIDGDWKPADMWVEIVCLEHGDLYVGGDIDSCVFSRYLDSNEPRARVNWLGSKETGSDYVVKKALVGMGRESVYKQCPTKLEQDFNDLLTQLEEFCSPEDVSEVRNTVCLDLGRDVTVFQILGILPECQEYIGESFGMIVDPKIDLAHHALRRLNTLLAANDGGLRTVHMRLNPQTIENFAAVTKTTGARSGADAVAYSADLARKITDAAKAGKDIYFDDGESRDRLFLPGIQS